MGNVARPERVANFVAKLVSNGFRAQQAVIDSGITTNRNSANVIAWRMMHDPRVEKAIKKHMDKTKMSADDVLERLTQVARSDVEFKGSDVVKATELLGKGHGLFRDVVETTSTTERDAAEGALLRYIVKTATQTGVSELVAARELFTRLADDGSLLRDVNNWPERDSHGQPLRALLMAAAESAPDEVGGEM